jgi:prepilin signal peptidase PulO-like enzyme (type II secretory pathway)
MRNKIKAALITLLIIGALVSIVIAGYYYPMVFVIGLGTIAANALFYAVYVAVLHNLDVKDENKIGGQDEN